MDPKAFQGIGWKFPPRINSNGRVVVSSYEDDIRESIRIIIMTRPGERQMRPEFGCGAHDLVFDSINDITMRQVETTVFDALLEFEPRIEVLEVLVSEAADRGQLLISIDYRVRSTNARFNYVFPFYVNEGIS